MGEKLRGELGRPSVDALEFDKYHEMPLQKGCVCSPYTACIESLQFPLVLLPTQDIIFLIFVNLMGKKNGISCCSNYFQFLNDHGLCIF